MNRLVMPLMAALAAVLPAHENHVTMRLEGDFRIIESNGIPDHETGEFPNAHNPNSIQEQQFHFRMPANPGFSGEITQCQFQPWGVAVNGVVFDPGTAEFWNHDRDSGWRYEAIGGKMNLGLDQANAHVQPNGAYHYHGLPKPLLKGKQGMVLLGYAADGFPVYNDVAPKDPKDLKSPLIKLAPGYRLKQGQRPNGPKGAYDGQFTQDFEYVDTLGDLDECNGRQGVTPDYPQGTYYYVITDSFPYIPRCWKGTPDESFQRKEPRKAPAGALAPPRRRPVRPDEPF